MVLDVGPSKVLVDEAQLAAFVGRLAGASTDGPAAAARRRIDFRITRGVVPPGLRRLSEALASATGVPTPRQRHPVEDPDSVAAAVRDNSLVVLDGFGHDSVAAAIGTLIADGRRVVVTATDRAELAALTGALRPDVARRCVDMLPELTTPEQRELRLLLATATPAWRARLDQLLPPAAAFPAPAEVARLCARAAHDSGPGAGLLLGRLAGMDADRRGAVTGGAQRADSSLRALGGEYGWTWTLLSLLVQDNTHLATFDRLGEDTTQACAAVERAHAGPPVAVVGPLPAEAAEILRRYAEFLCGGGRNRAYFRSPMQREVQPVLRQIRVGAEVPETPEQVTLALEHVELAERLVRIDAGCREIGVPAPRGADELVDLGAALTRVGTAARAVGALRHDVLFTHPGAPVAVPDLLSAGQVAAVIVDYAANGSPEDADRRLARIVAELTASTPAASRTAEHDRALTALRTRDAAGYAAAMDDLMAARSAMRDVRRCAELLAKLGRSAPRLAETWEAASHDDRGGFGFAWFVEADPLLLDVPPDDAADVVLLLGAAELGVDRLLLTAVAPRLAAVVAPGAVPATDPATLLGVLHRASALVVSGVDAGAEPAGGRVVQLLAGRPRPAPGPARQAPA